MNEEMTSIYDFGLASNNKDKIIKFLDKLYLIPLEKSKEWEKEIFSFFSNEVIVPYLIVTSIKEENEKFIKIIKEVFFDNIINNKLVIWDSNECYKSLIKIRDSLKMGKNIKDYLPFFFLNNNMIRRMFIKRVDDEDLRFKNFGVGISPICYELKKEQERIIIGYETLYFILPDKELNYPIEEWHTKISKEWKLKLSSKLNKKNNHNKRNPIDSRLRHECFKRDDYTCKECGVTNKNKTLHADHILPVSQGGKDELDNLQTLCEDCNLAKSNKKWEGGKNGNQ